MAKVDYATLKKGGFMRQKQKNNFSLRLACVGGALTAENLKKIAEVAEKYGDGYVHLTSRQGVEIPFIKLDDIDDVTADLAKGGCRPGVLVGAITMGFRYYGVYETGVCFALLTVNSISGWMDRTESRLYQLMHRPAAGKEDAE